MERGKFFHADPTAHEAIAQADGSHAQKEERTYSHFRQLSPRARLEILNGPLGDGFPDTIRASLFFEARREQRILERRRRR